MGHPSDVNTVLGDSFRLSEVQALYDDHVRAGGDASVRMLTCYAARTGHSADSQAQRVAGAFATTVHASDEPVRVEAHTGGVTTSGAWHEFTSSSGVR